MRWCAIAAVLLGAAPAAAQPRSLHWRALEVAAELDAEGRLHTRERHSMVFTGDWNGGEREFRVERGQRLTFRRLSRIDPVTGARDLRERNPPAVDEYFWARPDLLRWRSRAPTDPPFRATELVYQLEYTLENVLAHRHGTYRLDHDFALPFPDRAGPIERFVLDLRLHEAWRTPVPFPRRVERGPLLPGAGYVVRLDLIHAGPAPAAVDHGAPGWRRALLALFAAVVLIRLALFWRGERTAGRLEPLVPPGDVDAAWLEANLLHVPAEVVGATWDRSVGAPEVAATLARLEVEGRIETWAEAGAPSVRHLRLLVPRTSLRGHERVLMDALLVDGGDATDTQTVQRHYRSKGFDPAGVIRSGLEERVRELLGHDRKPGIARGLATVLLFLAGVAALAVALLREGDAAPLVVAPAALVLYLVAVPLARRWRRRVDGGPLAAGGFLLPIGLLVAGVWIVHAWEPRVSLAALAGSVALGLAFIHSALNQARALESSAALALRKRMSGARRFLEGELQRGSPDVQMSWYPHLLALGLAREADRWSAARPDRDHGSSWSDATSGSTSGVGSRSEPFSAGGGRFGGAGATGSWAAAQAFSASIAAPSSSGDSGGGGGGSSGGSSSSGGGGGGGW